MDLVENPPSTNPYTVLKGRLVLAHQLTSVQKATKCLKVVAGCNQRPSEMLAALLEFCPPVLTVLLMYSAPFPLRASAPTRYDNQRS